MLPELTKLKISAVHCEHVSTHLVTGDGRQDALVTIGADFRFEVPGQSSVGLIGGGRGQWLGEPPAGSRSRAPGQGARGLRPPEAENILVIGCPTEPANLAPLVKFNK